MRPKYQVSPDSAKFKGTVLEILEIADLFIFFFFIATLKVGPKNDCLEKYRSIYLTVV